MSRAHPRFSRTNTPLPSTVGQGVVVYIIQGSVEGQETINTFTYLGPTSLPTLSALILLIGNIGTNLLTKYRACVSDEWTLTREVINVITTQVIQGYVSTLSTGVAGTAGVGHLPLQNAIVCRRQTATKGQHGRGRVYLPSVLEGGVTSSTVTLPALITSLNAFILAMVQTASDGTNTWTPCVAQRSNIPPKLVIGAQALSGTSYSTLIGTIRRRRIGRGK